MNEGLLEFSVVFSGRAHYAQQTVVLLLKIVRRTVGKGVEKQATERNYAILQPWSCQHLKADTRVLR